MKSLGRFGGGSNNASGAIKDKEFEADGSLPADWKMVTSRSTGKVYYVHAVTGETQWEKPMEENKGTKKVAGVISSGASRLGAGITSMFNTANSKLQSSLSTSRPSSDIPRKSRSLSSNAANRAGQEYDEVFENQRVVGELHATDPKAYSDILANPGSGTDSFPEVSLIAGFQWTSEWEVEKSYTSTDSDGWSYGPSFEDLVKLLEDDSSHASKHPNDLVRRRRWIRYRSLESDTSVAAKEQNVAEKHDPDENNPISTDDGSGLVVEDPFSVSQKSSTSGFRVPNMKFPLRGEKDHTKDYQNLGLEDINWLVKLDISDNSKSAEAIRAETADLEGRIKSATHHASDIQNKLQKQKAKYSKRATDYRSHLEALVEQYKKLKETHTKLEESVLELQEDVDALKFETTASDNLQNEEQRALNDDTEAANAILEEKAKALATARIRYKRDIKALSCFLDDAKSSNSTNNSTREHHDFGSNSSRSELQKLLKKLESASEKLENARHYRLEMEEKRRDMFKYVVEQKADKKLNSKETIKKELLEIEDQYLVLKEEQRSIVRNYDKSEEMNARRNEIRDQLGDLRERKLNIKKQLEEG